MSRYRPHRTTADVDRIARRIEDMGPIPDHLASALADMVAREIRKMPDVFGRLTQTPAA